MTAQNWLFAGSDDGGERAAAIYSLIGTVKFSGIEDFRPRRRKRASR